MSRATDLFELQRVDLDIESKQQALAEVESQLGDSEAVAQLKEELAVLKERLSDLELEEQMLEWDADGLLHKAVFIETKLYDGSVKNPKELSSLQMEAEMVKTHRREKEEKALNIIMEIEDVKEQQDEKKAELERLEKEWAESQQHLREQRDALINDIASLTQQRQNMAAQINKGDFDFYESLRKSRQGRAVAKVERGTCQGCRISLSMSELQRAKAGLGLVQCSSCGRILYVS